MEMGIKQEKKLFSLLWSYIRRDLHNLYLTIIFLIINTALTIAAPLFFQKALSFIDTLDRQTTDTRILYSLITALLFYVVLSILSWFSTASIMVFATRLNSNIIRALRIDTFSSLIKNNIEFYDTNESGNVVSILSNDLNELYQTGNAIADVITSILKLIGIVIILFMFSPILTITSLLMLPVFFVVTMIIRKYRRTAESNWRKKFGQVNHAFAEVMRSLAVSKAFNREEDNITQFTELNEATFRASIRRGAAIFVTRPVADFLRNILLILILAVGTWQVQAAGLSVAVFYLFVFLLEYYYEPIRGISHNYNNFQSLFANLERILDIAHSDLRYEKSGGDENFNEFTGHVELQNVHFTYDGEIPILSDISFNVPAGQKLAIVGHTGAGKTTIASILMGFYPISSGQILFDGIPLSNYSLHSLRRQIGLVSQRILLFKGTIRDNLLIADQYATDNDLWQAIDAVQAREFIDMLPNGLDFQIEHHGKNLSVGQRQMLSFARTLLAKPKLIILDEATSSVDLYTESKIQQATDLLLKGTTAIVIAHRLTTIIKSDLIAVLEEGQVKQLGSHEELIDQEGSYKEMYDLYFQTQSAKYLDKIKH